MSDKLSRFLFAAILLFAATFAHSQTYIRWDLGSPGGTGAATVQGSGLPFYVGLPGVSLSWCYYPAVTAGPNTPCTNNAPTFTDVVSGTQCPTNQPIVLQGGSTCQATGDSLGNIGVNTLALAATPFFYTYTLTYNGVTAGPYLWSPPGAGGGGGGGGIPGVTPNRGLQIAPSTGTVGLLNTCSSLQTLQWSGILWQCASAGLGTVTGATANGFLALSGSTLGFQNGTAVGQIPQWNGTGWVPALGVTQWSGLSNAIAPLALTNAFTSIFTSSNHGTSPVPCVTCYNSPATTASTDTSFEFGMTIPVGSYHNGGFWSIGGFNLLQLCNTDGNRFVGAVVIGPTNCLNLDTSVLSQMWTYNPNNLGAMHTFFASSSAFTGTMQRYHAAAAASSAFNVWTYCPLVNATSGLCTSGNILASLNGLGNLFVQGVSVGPNAPGVCSTAGQLGCFAFTGGNKATLNPLANQAGMVFDLGTEEFWCTTNGVPVYPCANPFIPGQHVNGGISGGTVSAGIEYDTTNLTASIGEPSHDLAACLALSISGTRICNMEAESSAATTESISSSVANVTIYLPPLLTIGSGFSYTLSGAHVHLKCRIPKGCIILGAAAAVTNVFTLTGANSGIHGIHYEGGRCGTVACAASTVSGGAQTENAFSLQGTGDESSDNLMEDCGKICLSFVNCNQCKSKDDRFNRAGTSAIYVNATTGSQDGVIDGCVIQDSDTTGATSGAGSNQGQLGLASTGGVGFTSGWIVQNCTVRNLVFTTGITNICNGFLTTGATGCKQSIQIVDNVAQWKLLNNNVYFSQNEAIATSGYGGVISGNKCEADGLLGAGVGCIMVSYSSPANATIGGITITGNEIHNSSTFTPAYGISVQFELNAGANSYAVNYNSINVSGNCIDDSSGTGGFTAALRYFNSAHSGNSVTLNNVGFHNPCITLVNGGTPVALTYASSTTGAVTLDDGPADPSPVYASGCSTGTPTITGSFHDFQLAIGATPATTCTLTMPRA